MSKFICPECDALVMKSKDEIAGCPCCGYKTMPEVYGPIYDPNTTAPTPIFQHLYVPQPYWFDWSGGNYCSICGAANCMTTHITYSTDATTTQFDIITTAPYDITNTFTTNNNTEYTM